jgi:hypothetical protein
MNEPSTPTETPPSVEEGVNALLCNARQGIRQSYGKFESRIRNSPTKAVLGAVAAGYLIHRLPMRAIVVTQVRVLAALTPPALLLFGAAKLFDFLQRQKRDEPRPFG